MIESKTIEMRPLALLRGSNIRDAFIICDEAQNAQYVQLHMFLTRFARGSRVVVTGDVSQTDLPHRGKNPLYEVLERFRWDCHRDISMVELNRSDTQRDPLTAWVDERLTGNIPRFESEWQNEPWQEPESEPVRFDPDEFGQGLSW